MPFPARLRDVRPGLGPRAPRHRGNAAEALRFPLLRATPVANNALGSRTHITHP